MKKIEEKPHAIQWSYDDDRGPAVM